MKKLPKLSIVVACLAFSCLLGSVRAEEQKSVDTRPELLILKNGQVLEGRVTKLKNHHLVDLQSGEIQVRNADVDFVCRTREEGYAHKREVIQTGDWREHLELARWCFKNGLSKQAEDELSAAEGSSPNNPMIDSMRRQMRPIETAVKQEKSAAADELAANDELDRMVRNLPPRAMETFTQTVQPLLMNNCTASGCHGPLSTNNLRLIRVSTADAANRRSTQRNLQAVLQYVDRNNPLQSELLKVPAAPHGTAKNAVFTERRSMQYLRLADWVACFGTEDSLPLDEMLLPNPAAEEMPDDSISAPKLLSRDAQTAKPMAHARKPKNSPPAPDSASSGVSQASFQEPPADFLDSKSIRPSKTPLAAPKRQPTLSSKVQRGAPLPKTDSQDPLDPDVFNRRYHKAPPPKAEEESADESPTTEKSPRKG